MSQPGGAAIPFGRKQSASAEDHEYAMWDAAYVLGSLSSAERREFETHMGTCPSCRQAVAEISGMPALLSRLQADDVAEIDEHGQAASAPPPLRPELLTTLMKKVMWRRRRSRVMTWAVAATAAAVLVVGVFVAWRSNPAGLTPAPPPQASASALVMTPVMPTTMSATITLSGHRWGTQIEMNCTYGVETRGASDDQSDEAGDKLAMVVVGRDGSQARLATWVGLAGVTASPGGSTSLTIDQIAAVQVVSADDGNVLLQRTM
ncbi:MAG: zf-HC2 domain-containing protein [Mycobacteriaceae bacterium]|nr:zf-HC2 domain-containing protein [Mycobacteriaceae bacterium]